MINLFHPYVPEEAITEVVATLRTKFIAQGYKVDKFEHEFSKRFRQNYCVSVNSGTSAIEIAYDLIGLKEGDEVITTPLTCTATNIPLLHKKVKIVWADILRDTLCIDPEDVLKKITTKTAAVVQVHLGGVQADVGWLPAIPVVSDACQALGIFNSAYTACSFQAIKHITTGDGGMLVVKNEDEYRKAKLMRWFGIDRERQIPSTWESYRTRMMSFDIDLLGGKKQMNDIDAVMGLAGLAHYDRIMAHRNKLAKIYKEMLFDADIQIIDAPVNTWWLFTVLVERRDDFARMLYDWGVETNIVQRRNDVYTIFGGKKADLPVLNSIEDKYISLPIGMHVQEDDVAHICKKIRKGW